MTERGNIRRIGDVLLVMAGAGALGWDPQGWLSPVCLPAWGLRTAPACESVAVCLGAARPRPGPDTR